MWEKSFYFIVTTNFSYNLDKWANGHCCAPRTVPLALGNVDQLVTASNPLLLPAC